MSRIDQPIAGHYTVRIIRGGLRVPVRLWREGAEWRVEVNGRTHRDDGAPLDPFEVWPYCNGHRITETEYRFLRLRASWAEQHEPAHPAADPRKPVDVRSLKPGW